MPPKPSSHRDGELRRRCSSGRLSARDSQKRIARYEARPRPPPRPPATPLASSLAHPQMADFAQRFDRTVCLHRRSSFDPGTELRTVRLDAPRQPQVPTRKRVDNIGHGETITTVAQSCAITIISSAVLGKA